MALGWEPEQNKENMTKMDKALIVLCIAVGVIYFPVYAASYILRVIARLLLGISYLGLLRLDMAKGVFKHLFLLYD